MTIGNRRRGLSAGGIPVGSGRLDSAEAPVALVGHLAAIVRVLAVAVRRLLGVRRGVLAESLESRLVLLARRGATAATRVLAALVIVDGRLVLRRVVLLDGPTRHAALDDVSLGELSWHFKAALLDNRKEIAVKSRDVQSKLMNSRARALLFYRNPPSSSRNEMP